MATLDKNKRLLIYNVEGAIVHKMENIGTQSATKLIVNQYLEQLIHSQLILISFKKKQNRP